MHHLNWKLLQLYLRNTATIPVCTMNNSYPHWISCGLPGTFGQELRLHCFYLNRLMHKYISQHYIFKKQELHEQLYKLHLECANYWNIMWQYIHYLLTPWNRVPLEKLTRFCSQKKKSPHFWNPKVPHRTHKRPPQYIHTATNSQLDKMMDSICQNLNKKMDTLQEHKSHNKNNKETMKYILCLSFRAS